MYRRQPQGRLRTERWAREDDAPRLADEFPHVERMVLQLSELLRGQVVPGSRHTKHILVRRAAALFEVPCSDPKCQEGGYDFTNPILNQLRAGHSRFEGSGSCNGYAGDRPCDREVHYVAQVDFAPEADVVEPPALHQS